MTESNRPPQWNASDPAGSPSETPAKSPSAPPRFESAGSSNRYVLSFGLFMLVGLVALAWIGRPPRISAVGEKLPILDLQPLLNATAVSNESLAGKVVVLHFWGTWCGPCQVEFPEFAELVHEFADDERVTMLSVSCSSGPEYDLKRLATDTQAFLDQFDVSVPTYSDNTAMTRQQVALLLNGSLGYPTTLLVDQNGVIVESMAGYLPGEMLGLSDKIKSLL